MASCETPEVSVIVAAYNEQGCIADCLGSLMRQTHPSFEVIVVDDGSTDGTVDVVRRFERVRLIQQPHLGVARAINRGAQEARGEILLILDADQRFTGDFIVKLVQPITEGRAVGTNTFEEYVANLDNVWALCWNIEEGLPLGQRVPGDPDDSEMTAFRAIRRDAFLRIGGYDDVGSGSDQTGPRKLGRKAQVAPGAVCFHRHPESLSEVFYQARWKGRGSLSPKTWHNLLVHTPLWSLKNSVRKVLRYGNIYFPIFKVVFDFGILVGTAQSMIRPERHWK
jgi:glycosyltransferase involved in cell wall biosynthesis